MSYKDPYDPNQSQHTYQNWSHEQGLYDNPGGQRQGDYGFEEVSHNLWHQQSEDYDQSYQWTNYGDPGDTDKSKGPGYTQESIDSKYDYSNYQYPPFHPNRRTSQKSGALSKREPSLKAVPFPAPVQGQYVGVNQSGFDKGEFMPKRCVV